MSCGRRRAAVSRSSVKWGGTEGAGSWARAGALETSRMPATKMVANRPWRNVWGSVLTGNLTGRPLLIALCADCGGVQEKKAVQRVWLAMTFWRVEVEPGTQEQIPPVSLSLARRNDKVKFYGASSAVRRKSKLPAGFSFRLRTRLEWTMTLSKYQRLI